SALPKRTNFPFTLFVPVSFTAEYTKKPKIASSRTTRKTMNIIGTITKSAPRHMASTRTTVAMITNSMTVPYKRLL
ncbi:MAG TPA: hypothetical protein PK451_05340, partial [Ruminococcus bicirculans (ex Wegman et al. 2014)]|nr:hypothetical protein [Ruminococcus bicirculans (ex Wegman et al. 2014)]